MHISYDEAVRTPLKVVIRQMEYRNIENQIREQKQQNANTQR